MSRFKVGDHIQSEHHGYATCSIRLTRWRGHTRRATRGETATTSTRRSATSRRSNASPTRFDALMSVRRLNLALSLWGQKATGLPIDCQIQSITEGNAETTMPRNYPTPSRRIPLGLDMDRHRFDKWAADHAATMEGTP